LDNGDRLGRATASIGDVDGDGNDDIAVCSSRDGDGGTRKGAIFIITLDSDGNPKQTQKISELFGGHTELGGDLDDEDLFGTHLQGSATLMVMVSLMCLPDQLATTMAPRTLAQCTSCSLRKMDR
jgi:hypothetical protein